MYRVLQNPSDDQFVAQFLVQDDTNESPQAIRITKELADDPEAVVEVFLWPEANLPSEFAHVYKDGIDRSPFLRSTNNIFKFLPDNKDSSIKSVWMGIAYAGDYDSNDDDDNFSCDDSSSDTGDASKNSEDCSDNKGGEFANWCASYEKVVRKAQGECLRQDRSNCYWHVYIVDYSDGPNQNLTCPGIEDAMTRSLGHDGEKMVHYFQRSIVVGRKWNPSTQWIDPGRRIEKYEKKRSYKIYRKNPSRAIEDPTAVAVSFPSIGIVSTHLRRHRHVSYPVRSDILGSVKERIKTFHNISFSPLDPIESLWNRPIDIAHFWPLDTTNTSKTYQDWVYPKFRWKISSVLLDYCDLGKGRNVDNHVVTNATNSVGSITSSSNFNTSLSCFVDVAGTKDEEGRRGVRNLYVDTMLRSKIIVLSQRDEWEDQYRLMEAMVSGAMVMTDAMLSLPAGFQDGVSIVEYDSSRALLEKLAYYLDPQHASKRMTIAREGRKLAMERHRSWHRMEEIIFGRILTTPDLMVG